MVDALIGPLLGRLRPSWDQVVPPVNRCSPYQSAVPWQPGCVQWFAGLSLLFLGTNWRRAVVRINGVHSKVQRCLCGVVSQRARKQGNERPADVSVVGPGSLDEAKPSQAKRAWRAGPELSLRKQRQLMQRRLRLRLGAVRVCKWRDN